MFKPSQWGGARLSSSTSGPSNQTKYRYTVYNVVNWSSIYKHSIYLSCTFISFKMKNVVLCAIYLYLRSTVLSYKVQVLCQSFTLKIVSVPISGSPRLLCVHCPLVPEPLRRAAFDSVHQVSHPSKCASWRLVSQSFVWEFLAKDINLCQQNKAQSHVNFPVHHIQVPGLRSFIFMWAWLVLFLSPMGSRLPHH